MLLRAPPGRNFASSSRSRCHKSTPLCPAPRPRESLPGLRSLRFEFRLAAYALRFYLVSKVTIAQRFHILRAHHSLIIGTVAVYEFSDRNFAVERQSYFTGRRAVFHLALLFVKLHCVEAIAHLVAPLIKRWAGRDDFDERESLFLERFADRPRQLSHMKCRPPCHVHRSGSFDQMRQVKRRFKRSIRV